MLLRSKTHSLPVTGTPSRPGSRIVAASGFTLIEALVSLTLIFLLSAATYWTFNKMNEFAMVSRLYTTAYAVAQNAVDNILSVGPFNPATGDVPAELVIGTHTPETAFIYTDPDTNEVVVTGTLTVTVSDPGTTMTDGTGATANLNMRKATAVVSYTFHNRTYSVSLSTLRTADQ